MRLVTFLNGFAAICSENVPTFSLLNYIWLCSDRILFTLTIFLFPVYMRNIMTAWFLPLFIIGGQLILLSQSDGSLSQPTIRNGEEDDQPSESKDTKSNESDAHGPLDENKGHFIAKVSSLNFLGSCSCTLHHPVPHHILNYERN